MENLKTIITAHFFRFHWSSFLRFEKSQTQRKKDMKKFLEKVNSECTEKEMGMLRMLVNKEMPQDKYRELGKKVRPITFACRDGTSNRKNVCTSRICNFTN